MVTDPSGSFSTSQFVIDFFLIGHSTAVGYNQVEPRKNIHRIDGTTQIRNGHDGDDMDPVNMGHLIDGRESDSKRSHHDPRLLSLDWATRRPASTDGAGSQWRRA
jgi:hypothetical protein